MFRLNTVEIHLPALRERREDIPVLALHFLSHYASRYRRAIRGLDPAALQSLMQYSWPGNVRELEHTLERAVLMCRSEQIQPADLGLGLQRSQAQNLEELSLEAVETILIRKALQRFPGQCEPGRRGARSEPGGAVSPNGKVWALARAKPKRPHVRKSVEPLLSAG